MQANFEARFNLYLSLTSDRANSCNFLTILFKRILHLFREKEWVTDRIILEKFRASIQSPNEKTQEIYRLFIARMGSSPLLDQINREFISKSNEERPKMKMSHSRFTPPLWDYACGRNLRSRLFVNVSFLTEDGEKLKEEEKNELKNLVDACISDNSVDNRSKLYAWMLNVEKEERKAFISFLSGYLDRILNGECSEKLKNDLRVIRKYLINRSFTLTKDNCGDSKQIYLPLLKLLFPDMNQTYRCFQKEKMVVKDNRIYLPENEADNAYRHFALGFVIGHEKHATAYIYDGKDYVWLDNGRPPKKISAQALYEHISKVKLDTSWDYYLIDEKSEPKFYPDPSRWSYPNWERNNCFIASSLALLASVYFVNRALPV